MDYPIQIQGTEENIRISYPGYNLSGLQPSKAINDDLQ